MPLVLSSRFKGIDTNPLGASPIDAAFLMFKRSFMNQPLNFGRPDPKLKIKYVKDPKELIEFYFYQGFNKILFDTNH